MSRYDRLPRIALAQMAVLPGQPARNLARMLELLGEARERGAELVAFPEMSLPGYILGDLWEYDAVVRDLAGMGEALREASAGLTVVFGNVAVDESAIGEDGRLRKFNAAWVAHDGRWLAREGLPGGLPAGVHPKTLHPDYRFFDDDRHFYSLRTLAGERGVDVYDFCRPFRVRLRDGREFRFGVQLCEDMWCQDYRWHGDTLDTLHAWHEAGAEVVINISASPWTWAKSDKRERTVRDLLARSPLPYLYVNKTGAQNNGKNILVFDGDTCAWDESGRVRARAEPWRERLLLVPDDDDIALPQAEEPAQADAVGTGVRHLDAVTGRENAFLVGVSGGVDSALVTALLVRALGGDRVFGVNMPTRFNADVTKSNARRLCETLGVGYLEFPIQDLYQGLATRIRDATLPGREGDYTRLVDENIQARMRGADVLAGLAARHGLLFTNNGNKTETALGYATLYGDVNGAVAPIADLYKTQVFALSRWLNAEHFGTEVIPANLLDGSTVPSAELSEAQDVTQGLGDPIRYGYHDAVLRQMIEYRRHPLEILEWYADGTLFDRVGWQDHALFRRWFGSAQAFVEDVEWLWRQLHVAYFKRVQAPPIIVLSKRAFGFDLRESQVPAPMPRAYAALRERVTAMPLP